MEKTNYLQAFQLYTNVVEGVELYGLQARILRVKNQADQLRQVTDGAHANHLQFVVIQVTARKLHVQLLN